MIFHYHPDQTVYIRDENGKMLYFGTPVEFVADFGLELPTIKAHSYEYSTNTKHLRQFDRFGNDTPSIEEVPYIEDILATLPAALVAAAERRALEVAARLPSTSIPTTVIK